MFVPVWACVVLGVIVLLMLALILSMRRCINCLIGAYADAFDTIFRVIAGRPDVGEIDAELTRRIEFHKRCFAEAGSPLPTLDDARRLVRRL